MKVKTVKGLLVAGAMLASVAAWGGEPVTSVSLAVDFRPSPRTLASVSEFQPITYDGGDWSGAASSADVTVSLDSGAAKTLVNGATKAGALVFTAIGPGHYVFTHTANGENLTAAFDLANDEAKGGDIAALSFDSRVFTETNPRVVNDLAEDLWPVTYSATGWAKEGSGQVTVNLASDTTGKSVGVLIGATDEGQFALATAATGLSTLTHTAGAATETAYLRFGDDVTVKIDTTGDGEGDTEVSAFGGGTWLDPAVASLITAIEPDPADEAGWLVTFDPELLGEAAGVDNFSAWYAASVLNGRLGLKTATTPEALAAAAAEAAPSSAADGRVTFEALAEEGDATFWQVEIND